ncbi:MAG: inositol monophosphatase family protein [Bacteroidales bacterium]
MILENICRSVVNIAKTTGDFALNEIEALTVDQVKQKGEKDLVTYIDHASEKRIVTALVKILPDAGFDTEEKTVEHEVRDFIWIIDPLDGTTNYVHGIPFFSVSIALTQHGKVILGVVYIPALGECFHSFEGGDVYLNDKPIRVSQVYSLADAIIATGFPYDELPDVDSYMRLLKVFITHSHGIRRFGSAAIDLAYVACGRFDAFYEAGLNSWDVSAGAFLVKQAGGEVSDFSGGCNYIERKEIIACNKALYPRFFDITNSYLVSKTLK